MTTIPTIANRSMLRGLIGWNENHYEKWKMKICGEAGEALMDFISDEFTEPGAYGECNLKDYIPEEDVKGGDYTEKLILKEGSRSFYMGLECMFQRCYSELTKKSNVLRDINYLTLISGCGTVEDWSYKEISENCLPVREWYGWVGGKISGYTKSVGEYIPPEEIKISEKRKEILQRMLDDGKQLPTTWWGLAEYLENEINEIKKKKRIEDSLESNNKYLKQRNVDLMEKNNKLKQELECERIYKRNYRDLLEKVGDLVTKVEFAGGSFGVKGEQSDGPYFVEEWNELVEKVKPYVEDQF